MTMKHNCHSFVYNSGIFVFNRFSIHFKNSLELWQSGLFTSLALSERRGVDRLGRRLGRRID
jgi:hypothetical protein